MSLEDDPGDLGAADAVGGKLGIGAGIQPPVITGGALPGGDRADDAADAPADGPKCRAEAEPGHRAGEAQRGQRRGPSRSGVAPRAARKRDGRLTVGTDCGVGKLDTALALEREMQAGGMKAGFRATGQTGIFIAGRGVSVDAVVSDFVSGATEWLTPANDADHWDLIEGQGSLFHVSYSGVSLGLLHGSQPEALVLCHDASRRFNDDFPDIELPSLEACAEANLSLARLSNPAARLVGVALNTSNSDPAGVERLLAETADRLGVPCVDPVATGVAAIVDKPARE